MTAQNGEGVYGNGAGVVTPLAHKLSQNGPLVKDSTGKPRSGVFYAGTATLVTGKASMAYDVAAFEAAICRARTKGTSFPTNDGVVTVPTTTAPGANSRIDIVYVQQAEASEGDPDTEAVIGVVQGTASSSPTAPALPDGALELARAVVGAGITGTQDAVITQTAKFTVPLGSPIPFRNSTERDAAGTFPPYTRCVLLDTGAEFVYSSGWKAVGSPACVLRKSANQSLSTAAQALTWDVETADPVGMHDGANPTRITAPVAGVYEVAAQVYNNNTSGLGTLYLRLNGTTDVPASGVRREGGLTTGTPLTSVSSVALSAGDYIEVMVVHSAATGLIAGNTTSLSTTVSVKRIGGV